MRTRGSPGDGSAGARPAPGEPMVGAIPSLLQHVATNRARGPSPILRAMSRPDCPPRCPATTRHAWGPSASGSTTAGLRWTPQRRTLVEVLAETRGPRHRAPSSSSAAGSSTRRRSRRRSTGRSTSSRSSGSSATATAPTAARSSTSCPARSTATSTARCGGTLGDRARTRPPRSSASLETSRGFAVDLSHVTIVGRCRACRDGGRPGHPAGRHADAAAEVRPASPSRPDRSRARPGIGLGLSATAAGRAGAERIRVVVDGDRDRRHDARPARPRDQPSAGLLPPAAGRPAGPPRGVAAVVRLRVQGPGRRTGRWCCRPAAAIADVAWSTRTRRRASRRSPATSRSTPAASTRPGSATSASTPQAGDFYGGWITSRVVGPFKGGPGTWGW